MIPSPPIALEHVFVVRVGGGSGGGELLGAFTEISGIGAQFETFDYPEGGNPYLVKLRGRTQQNNITLKTGLTNVATLMNWVLSPNPEPKDVFVIFQTTGGDAIRSFGFAGAIPVSWTGPAANIGANAVATEALELAHQGFVDAA